MKIDKKDLFKIKRVVLKDKEIVGVLYPEQNHQYTLETLSGETVHLKREGVLDVRIVRNIPKDVRAIMEKRVKDRKVFLQKEIQFEKIKKELEEELFISREKLKGSTYDLKKAYFEAYGIYNPIIFQNLIKTYIDDIVKETGNLYYSNLYTDVSFREKLNISLCLEAHKYAQPGQYGLLYEEHDGTLHVDYNEDRVEDLVTRVYEREIGKSMKDTRRKIEEELKKEKIEGSIYGNAGLGDNNTFMLGLNLSLNTEPTEENLEKIKRIIDIIL